MYMVSHCCDRERQAAQSGTNAILVKTPTPEARREEEYPAAARLGEAYASYQSTLQEIFQNIRDGVLATASESLLAVSDWLLSYVEELGMCFATE